ncbi:MAG: molybdopterin-dependent oxidoreductase [Verrucomicrobia bacterium]|nr:molybdopterin-dependent oxidoreductase [Verrucomicrobiota bacterium]
MQHYGVPKIDLASWNLEIGGLERNPTRLTLDDLEEASPEDDHRDAGMFRQQRQRWVYGRDREHQMDGHAARAVVRECEPCKRGIEVAFFGADTQKDEVKRSRNGELSPRGLHMADAMRDDIFALLRVQRSAARYCARRAAASRGPGLVWRGVGEVAEPH